MGSNSNSDGQQPGLAFVEVPNFDPVAPSVDEVTDYDALHFIDYARLLDAADAGHDWQRAARDILRMNPDMDASAVQACWSSHLERARWFVTAGYRQLLVNAGLTDTPESSTAQA